MWKTQTLEFQFLPLWTVCDCLKNSKTLKREFENEK